jgi:hypothetical protein
MCESLKRALLFSACVTALSSVPAWPAAIALRAHCGPIAGVPSGMSVSCSYYDQGPMLASASFTMIDSAHMTVRA